MTLPPSTMEVLERITDPVADRYRAVQTLASTLDIGDPKYLPGQVARLCEAVDELGEALGVAQ